MDANEKAFLEEIQRQCLVDAENHLNGLRETIGAIKQDPVASTRKAMQIAHTLKANVQAVGFKTLGEFLHRLEGAIEKVLAALTSTPEKTRPGEDDLMVLEFLLGDAVGALASYVDELKQSLADHEDLASKRATAVAMLDGWTPSTASVTAAAPIAATPAAPVAQQAPTQTQGAARPPVAVAAVRAPEPPENGTYLLCRHRKSSFAIPIQSVMEIVQAPALEDLPSPRPDLAGLMNLRGEVIPVLKAMEALTQRSPASNIDERRTFIVVCQYEGLRFGLPVEHSDQVADIQSTLLQPVAASGTGNSNSAVTHYILMKDETVLVLDMNRVVIGLTPAAEAA